MNARPDNLRGDKDVVFGLTSVVDQVMADLALTQKRRWMTSLQGPPGIGKTTAALRYAEENPRRVWYYAARPDTAAKGPLFRDMAVRFTGFRDVRTLENVQSLRLTAQQLNSDFGPVLLIVDEAQNLNPDTLETLRAIFDEGALSLAFIGNHTFTDRFKYERGSLAASPQFLSRIDLTRCLGGLLREDVATVARAHGFPESLIDKLTKLAGGVRGLRAIDSVSGLARERAKHRAPTIVDFEAAIEHLFN